MVLESTSHTSHTSLVFGKETVRLASPSVECLTMTIDYFIAYNNCKDTIVVLNTSKDHGKSVRYYLQQLGKNTQQTKHILIVDDEYDINLALEYILNQNGFNVYSSTNSLIALESAKPGLFDPAILDVKYIMKCRQQKCH